MRRYAWPMRGRDILDMARVLPMWYFTVTRRLTPTSEASMEIQRIIDDSSLSTEAKVILLTAEIVNPNMLIQLDLTSRRELHLLQLV